VIIKNGQKGEAGENVIIERWENLTGQKAVLAE